MEYSSGLRWCGVGFQRRFTGTYKIPTLVAERSRGSNPEALHLLSRSRKHETNIRPRKNEG